MLSSKGEMLSDWSKQIILSEDVIVRNGMFRDEACSQSNNEQHRDDLMVRECNNMMTPKIKEPNYSYKTTHSSMKNQGRSKLSIKALLFPVITRR